MAVDQGERIRQYLKLEKGSRTLVAFMDFQCPSCQKNWPGIRAALKQHPEVHFYSVSFPLVRQHKDAFNAAVAYEVARSTGAQRAVYEALLSGRQGLDAASLNRYLKAHRLPAVVGTPRATKYEDRVNEQLKFATSLAIAKTPTLVLIDANGSAATLDSADKLSSLLN